MKPHLQYQEMISLLRGRGLAIESEVNAIATLKRVGYYRLSGYLYPFRRVVGGIRENAFMDGSTFDYAVTLYDVDERLRSLLTEGLSIVEVALGARVAQVLGATNPEAHLDATYLDSITCERTQNYHGVEMSAHAAFVQRFRHLRAEALQEDYVKHHVLHHDGRVPLWAAVQFMDFGCILRLYTFMKPKDQRKVAESFGLSDDRTGQLAKLMRPLNVLRNDCAHNNRVWNRKTIYPPPRMPVSMLGEELHHLSGLDDQARNRLYALAAVIAYFVHYLHRDSGWIQRFRVLVESFVPMGGITPEAAMGFPPEWSSLKLWS